MALGLTGPEALKRFDDEIGGQRARLAEAIEAADRVQAREADVRGGQVELYRQLAGLRLEAIGDMAPDQLDKLHRAARELLLQHEKYVAWELAELQKASADIGALESKRTTLAKAHEAAVEHYEAEVARVEADLKQSVAYAALVTASEETAAVATRAHQKLELARTDLDSKGKPYVSDKLFKYLWERKFRTPEYRAGPFTRMLDHWVASLCKYDSAWMNFQRLKLLPEWLAEHAAEQDKKSAAAVSALEIAELDALEKSGANALKKNADDALASVRAIDAEIDQAEARHQAIAARHTAALKAEEGPAKEARRLLEEGLQRASFRDLRTLSAETLALDDDRVVDGLVKLRTEEMQLELEGEKLGAQPDRLRATLSELEALRRHFKQARFDSHYAVFSSATVDEVLGAILQGRVDSEGAVRFLGQAVRRIEPRAEPEFGGYPRRQTSGLPDVLGDILWEVAKESMRGGTYRGRSTSFPSSGSRRSPRINIPSGGGSRGGGGRRGGGFKTGGGF